MMTYSLREKGIKNAEKSVNDIIRELSECPSIQNSLFLAQILCQRN